MRLTWPALRAELVQHTVEWRGARFAGFLVRDTGTRKDLGYVWQAGSVWRWRTPDQHSGERTSQKAAVEVLRDAHDLRQGGAPELPRREAPVVVHTPTRPTPRPAPAAAPSAPRRTVQWGATVDLTAAISAALNREKNR